jgi:hypothetical protein
VRRVGFALDDLYVEQVWAGVIGPSALLVLRRLPVLWRERAPAVVDLRERGQSLGLGPSLARSGRTWRTIERLVGFGMAHWLPGDELGVRTEVATLSSRQLARVPEWTRQVHNRLLGTHLDRLALAHTDPTLDPGRFLDPGRSSTPPASPPTSWPSFNRRPTPRRPARPAVDNPTQMVSRPAIGRRPGFRVVLDEHLGSVALALSHHADVEPGVEQLRGRELTQRQDRAIEVLHFTGRRCGLPAQRRAHRQLRPAPRPAEPPPDLRKRHPALGRGTRLARSPRRGRLAEQPQRLVLQQGLVHLERRVH